MLSVQGVEANTEVVRRTLAQPSEIETRFQMTDITRLLPRLSSILIKHNAFL